MPTLADMKSRIRAEIDRDDLDTAIGLEIGSAINFYRSRRFWFTERRAAVMFDTAADQSDYSADITPDLSDLVDVDSVMLTGDGFARSLRQIDMLEMGLLLGRAQNNSAAPMAFSYYAQELRFYPKPDAAYTINLSGTFRVGQPYSDDDANNAWMNEAEELIRARAKKQIYVAWMSDMQNTQAMDSVETAALDNLMTETSRRSSFRQFRAETL